MNLEVTKKTTLLVLAYLKWMIEELEKDPFYCGRDKRIKELQDTRAWIMKYWGLYDS